MKKVLIVGPEFFDYNLSIKSAFENLGWTTKVMGYHGGEVASTIERIDYHLTRDKSVFFEKKRAQFNARLLTIYKEFNPDIVFVIQASEVYKETIEQMTKSRKVLWMMDSIFRIPMAFAMRNEFDHIFLFEKTDVGRLWEEEKIRSWFLPLALDEKVYFPTVKTNEIDILFVGALYQKRIELLEKVCKEFAGRSIKIYGNYYSPFRRPAYHFSRKNKQSFLNKNIAPSEVNRLYNRSRICLNIHHEQSRYGVNQRFFEISGSRSFQVVDNNPFITENFSPTEVMTYVSTDDMLKKIEYVLSGNVNEQEMTENAYQKILAGHTFTQRIKQVLATIDNKEV